MLDSVLVTGYLLNPDTGLGWLGLMLSILFSALMWLVLKPYRRLTSLVTGNPVTDTQDTLIAWRARATGFARTAAATAFGTAAGQALADDNEDTNTPQTNQTTTPTNPYTTTRVPADHYRRPQELSNRNPSVYLAMTPADDPAPRPSGGNVLVAARRPAALESRAMAAVTDESGRTPPDDLPSATVGPTKPDDPTDPSGAIGTSHYTSDAGIGATDPQVIDVSDPVLSGEVIRRPEPTVVDGQELYVIYTPDEGLAVDDDSAQSRTERDS